MRAFVTGATGFLGRHLVRRLREQEGAEVETLKGDLFDPGALEGAARADVVFHLAAVTYVPDTLRDPENATRVNAVGTARVLESARRGDARVVFVSSSHVYGGTSRERPIEETAPIHPTTPYAATKVAGEALVTAYGESFDAEGVVLRPFNVYGPGQRSDFLIPTILAQARAGDTVKLGDVSPVRDFVYVEDAVDLMVRAATDPGAAGEAFNVATGTGTSVREVAERLIGIVNPDARLEYDASRLRAGDPSRLVGSRAKAERLLGWTPRHSVEEGLRATAEAGV